MIVNDLRIAQNREETAKENVDVVQINQIGNRFAKEMKYATEIDCDLLFVHLK